jgi:hypothetical protein
LIVAMLFVSHFFAPPSGLVTRIAVLAALVAGGAALYFLITWLAGAMRPADFARALRRGA